MIYETLAIKLREIDTSYPKLTRFVYSIRLGQSSDVLLGEFYDFLLEVLRLILGVHNEGHPDQVEAIYQPNHDQEHAQVV